MPRQGGKGLTPEEKQAQSKKMDEDITAFFKKMDAEGVTEPCKDQLTKHFDQKTLQDL